MELELQARLFCRRGRCVMVAMGFRVLDIPADLVRRRRPHARDGRPRVFARNSLEAWTEAHFEQPVVASGLSIGRAVVVSDPAAIRRVLLENCDNS